MGRINFASALHRASLSPRMPRGLTPGRRGRRRPLPLERLEDRVMLSVSVLNVPQWLEDGPGPITDLDTVTNNSYHLPGGNQVGAINQVAIDPGNPNHLVVATVNGGIWSTTSDSTENDPQWVPLTDQMPSLLTGSIAFSPLDSNTLFAGTDDFSSDGGDGGPLVGLYRSRDGGQTWTVLGSQFAGDNVLVLPTALSPSGTVANEVVFAIVGNVSGFEPVGPLPQHRWREHLGDDSGHRGCGRLDRESRRPHLLLRLRCRPGGLRSAGRPPGQCHLTEHRL